MAFCKIKWYLLLFFKMFLVMNAKKMLWLLLEAKIPRFSTPSAALSLLRVPSSGLLPFYSDKCLRHFSPWAFGGLVELGMKFLEFSTHWCIIPTNNNPHCKFTTKVIAATTQKTIFTLVILNSIFFPLCQHSE